MLCALRIAHGSSRATAAALCASQIVARRAGRVRIERVDGPASPARPRCRAVPAMNQIATIEHRSHVHLGCGDSAWFCGGCPARSHRVRRGSTGVDCRDESVRQAFPALCGGCHASWMRCGGICLPSSGRVPVPRPSSTVIFPLLCRPRYGSSLLESLLGESPDVLELQEMFNGFAHAPALGAALQFFGQNFFGTRYFNSTERAKASIRHEIGASFPVALELAAAMAMASGKRAVTFKIFDGCGYIMRELENTFRAHAYGSVALVLERNVFSAAVSIAAVHSRCSSYQHKDSTHCKTSFELGDLEAKLVEGMTHQCCARRAAGLRPFPPLHGVPVAFFRYEELEAIRSMSGKLELVQRRIRSAQLAHGFESTALRPWVSNGKTLRSYQQQDKDHGFESSVVNAAEVRRWFTEQRRSALCNHSIVPSCVNHTDPRTAPNAFLVESVMRWCMTTDAFLVPAETAVRTGPLELSSSRETFWWNLSRSMSKRGATT